MGQQQLLLLILAALLIIIPVGIGIAWMRGEGLDANRNAVRNDLILLSTKAQEYYRKPLSVDGGGKSFAGLSGDESIRKLVSAEFANNPNATYQIVGSGSALEVTFSAVSKATYEGVTPEYTCRVTPNTYSIRKVH